MTTNQYVHNIVKNFLTHFPIAYRSMQRVDHNDAPIFSSWHLEGSIWTHTMMVVSAMQSTAKHHKNIKELLVAALLHDVGKVYTREVNEEKQKVTFYGHPGFSTFLARDMLNKIDPELTEKQQQYILYLVNHHQVLFNLTDSMTDKAFQKLVDKFDNEEGSFLLSDLMLLRDADSIGRIATADGALDKGKYNQLEGTLTDNFLNYSQEGPTKKDDSPKAVIMVGLPGAGKSSYITEHLANYTLVSRDAQIEHLAGDMDYNTAFNTVDQKEVDNLYEQAFSVAIQKKQDLVVDKTNLTHNSRMKSINRLRDNGYSIKINVLMPTLLEVGRRNKQRTGKVIPPDVMRRMMTTFEMPFPTEGSISYIFS